MTARGGLTLLLLALATTAPAEESPWVREGLRLVARAQPEDLIDMPRLARQKAEGCADGVVRFGDTAAMRGTVQSEGWSRDLAELATVGSLADDLPTALAALDRALSMPGLAPVQRSVLENQRVLVALQFEDRTAARRLLADAERDPSPDRPLRADRLFWSVVIDDDAASDAAWRDDLLERLDAALADDPTSFQVRVWRVYGWLRAQPWEGIACAEAVRVLSDRVLDATEETSCPLLLGHISHWLDRALAARVDPGPASGDMAWRQFVVGMMAVLAEDAPLAEASRLALDEAPTRRACERELAATLATAMGEP